MHLLLCQRLKKLLQYQLEMENPIDNSPTNIFTISPEKKLKEGGDQEISYQEIAGRLQKNLRQLQINHAIEIPNLSSIQYKNEDSDEQSIKFQTIQQLVDKLYVSRYFNMGILIVLFIFLISCLLQDTNWNVAVAQVAQYFQLVTHILFIFFFACRAVKWKEQSMIWLFLDVVAIITGIVGVAVPDDQISRYFKAIRTLRLLFFIKEVDILNKPASDLMLALAKVGNILIPAIVIIYVYAVVGLYAFTDFEYNKCRSSSNLNQPGNWTVYTQEIFLCGEKTCPIIDGEQLQCLNPIDFGVELNPNELINIIQGNGVMKYSNIFFAVLSTVKQTFVTGSSRLIILYKQVLNPIFVEVYFYSYIYLISYIYLNIFYSLIITSEWDGQENDRQKLGEQNNTIKIDTLKNEDLAEYKLEVQMIQSQVDCVKEVGDPCSSQTQHKATLFVKKNQTNNVPCIQSPHNTPVEDESATIMVSSRGQKKLVDGELVLEKARVFNVFETIEQSRNSLSKDQFIINDDEQFKIDQSAKLASEYPGAYNKYEIYNNIVILLCCINLSLDFHGQNKQFKFVTDCIDFGFYCLLIVELVIKVLIERYALRKTQLYTKFEILIAIVCTGGVIYEAAIAKDFMDFFSVSTQASGVIRSFKYLRIMILILRSTFFNEARMILQSTFRSLYLIRHMIGVWCVIVVTFGLIGFHLHSYKTRVNKKTGLLDMQNGQEFQISYDGVFDSIIYTMLTFYNEEWDYIMFEQYLGGGALLIIWQLISICVGLLLFSKYFMALLMKELDNLIDESLSNQNDEELSGIDKQSQTNQQKDIHLLITNKIQPIDHSQKKKKRVSFENEIKQPTKNKFGKNNSSQQQHYKQNQSRQHLVKKCVLFFRKIIEDKVYKTIFCLFIISSCAVLVMTHPHVDRNSAQAYPYLLLDKINKGFFIADLFLNLLVYGLFQEEYSYLRRSWLNWLNIGIIIIQIASLTVLNTNFIFMKIQKIKVLRVLFFLELRYKHNWNMRITYHSFVQLLPKVLTLMTITLVMYSYFALVLVKLYKDDFYICLNYYGSANIVTKNDCLDWGGDWIQQSINVGNLFNSTLYLFFVATMEGWISLLYPMMNLAGENLQPIRDANKYINIFFVFFFFFGNLIMLNVFIGLSVSNFKRLKDKTTGESKLSKRQKQWLSVKTQIYRLNPAIFHPRPENLIRKFAFDIATHSSYKFIRGFFFCAFLITMSLFKTNMTEKEKYTLICFQYFFVAILILEYLIQVLAFGFKIKQKPSFIFKNFVVFYAIIYVIVSISMNLPKFDGRILGSIFIALQFIRYLSLLDEFPFARKLLNTIVSILPQTSNILLMICLTLFIYTIIGMELFSFLKPNIELDTFNQNYTNFSTALFALIKFSTMESPIQQISDAAQTMSPNFICSDIFSYEDYLIHGQKGCGNQVMAYVFFLSFHIFYSLLLMSTVMAVIVDSYSQVKREEEAPITKLVLDKVKSAWAKIDPEATGFIPYRQFWMFTAKLLQIYMGKQKATNSLSVLFASKQQFLTKMAIPIYENQQGVLCFQFHEVIQALTRIYMENNFNIKVSKKAEKMFKQRQSTTENRFKRSFYTSSHVATLIILKSGLRWWKKLATNETGRMEYKNVISKFNKEQRANP